MQTRKGLNHQGHEVPRRLWSQAFLRVPSWPWWLTFSRTDPLPIVRVGWRVLSPHLFGCEEERVCQQGQSDQQRNQSGEIDRLVVHQPMQKRHNTDADDGGDQSTQLQAFEAALCNGLILFTQQFDRGLGTLA